MKYTFFALALTVPTIAFGDVGIRFIEGAPTDRFVISNDATCATGPFEMSINLTSSAGKLIFDTTAEGAGVEVFQPLKLASGGDAVTAVTTVTDGDQTLTLSIAGLAPGASLTLTADLDDQLTNSELGQIRVSGAEIQGARATALTGDISANGEFGVDARASLPMGACTS